MKCIQKFLLPLLAILLVLPAFAQLPTTCMNMPTGRAENIVTSTVGNYTLPITAASWTGGTATVTVANSLSIGNIVIVSGIATASGTNSSFNGQVTLTGASSTAIQYAVGVNPGTAVISTVAQVYYPGTSYLGHCIGGVVYQVPLMGTAVNVAPVAPFQVGPSTTYGQVIPNVCHAQYNYANDGGAISTITPVNGCTLPANAMVFEEIIYNSTAAAGTGGTLSIGIGASHAALMTTGTGAVANLSGSTFLQGVVVPQTASGFIHVASASAINFTIASTPFTAGVVDVYVFYVTNPS